MKYCIVCQLQFIKQNNTFTTISQYSYSLIFNAKKRGSKFKVQHDIITTYKINSFSITFLLKITNKSYSFF